MNYEQETQKVIRALDPELKRHLHKINGEYWIHSPLMVTSDLLRGAESLNEKFREKKAIAARLLKNVRFDPLGYLCLIEKPYRLQAFKHIQNKLSDAQYWNCLAYIWTSIEFAYESRADWLKLFSSARQYQGCLMGSGDRKTLASLPELLTVYRGYQSRSRGNKMGLSWTLSPEKAGRFAHRSSDGGLPMIAEGTCKKSDILGYTNCRDEQEVIIDPSKVTIVKRVPVTKPEHVIKRPRMAAFTSLRGEANPAAKKSEETDPTKGFAAA